MNQTTKIYDQFGNMHCIYEQSDKNQLYLGDFLAAQDLKTLRKKNVRTVLTCAGNLDVYYSDQIVHHIYEHMIDNENFNIYQYFDETQLAIQEGLNRGSVLVHCQSGVSRAATIVIAFMMKKTDWSFPQAFNSVKNKRLIICPNLGFIEQLKKYERQLFQEHKVQKQQQLEQQGISKVQYRQQQSFSKLPKFQRVQSASGRRSTQVAFNFDQEYINKIITTEQNRDNKQLQGILKKQQTQLPRDKMGMNDLKINNSPKNHITSNSKDKRSDSQVKLRRFAEKLSKEDVEFAYTKYDYKPGFKRITKQSKDKNNSKNYQDAQSQIKILEKEVEAEQKMKELEQFLINPFKDEQEFDEDLFNQFQKNDDHTYGYFEEKPRKHSRVYSAKILPNRNKENFSQTYNANTRAQNTQQKIESQNNKQNRQLLPPRPQLPKNQTATNFDMKNFDFKNFDDFY